MATFTTLSAWDHLQDRTAANEIVLAYSERRQCVGNDAIDPLASGGNAQDTAFWKGMQDWVLDEAQRTSGDNRWVDYTQYIDGESSFPFLTLSAWKTNSGLADGFRRATSYDPAVNDWTDYSDPMYSYGTIQAGDIRGPWIFEDLQAAFDALRWTRRDTRTSTENLQKREVEKDEDTLQESIDAVVAAWPSEAWVDGGTSEDVNYIASFTLRPTRVTASRQRAKRVYDFIADHIIHSAEHYIRPRKPTISGERPYNDTDGLDEDHWALMQEFDAEAIDTRTTDFLPFNDVPIPSDPVRINNNDTFYNANARDAENLLLLKWDFSHTL